MDTNSIVQAICIAIIPLIFAITLHEAAHGWMASRFGDKTASIMGRITLNPAKHIDLFGTIIVPLVMLSLGGFIFGWAKPVPIAWQNLRNPRRDMALVAIAGPGANLLMAIFWGAIAKLSHLIFIHPNTHEILRSIALFIHSTSRFGIMINCVLLVINLIPIPPLDGSRVVTSFLPINAARKYNRLEHYGLWIFLGLFFLMHITNTFIILQTPILAFMHAIYSMFGLTI